MKAKRHKHVRKALTFYKNHFGYKPPYHVVVDGTFCKAALKFKVHISEQLPKYLESEIILRTTNCVTAECEALGTLLYGPLKILRQFDIEHCGHGTAVPASKCLEKLAKKTKNKYMIATQDSDLSKSIRQLPGVPLLYIAHNAINLESPSGHSQHAASGVVHSKLAPSQHQLNTLDAIKKSVFGEPEEKPRHRRKGPKGPNPLSCKKRKKSATVAVSGVAASGKVKKRTRKKKKLSGQKAEQVLKQTE